MEQSQGRIATFYSYKGGTGRSMLLANFAWMLAASGKRVLAIDWDLEAPGLHRYFRPFLADPDLFETDGLIDTFWTLAASALATAQSGKKRSANEGSIDVAEAFEDATRRVGWKFATTTRTSGYIDFIGAGRQGGTYSERVNSFDWKRFYELGGAAILTAAKEYLHRRYDWVLIDSRTGISDISGICTLQMPSTVVACFTLNRQSIDGVTAILRAIRAFRSPSVDGSKIGFFPVATRIENAEQERLEAARGYARTELADFLPTARQSYPRQYWDNMEISYRPAYAFEEILAAFGDATGVAGAADTMASQTEATARVIADDPKLSFPEIVEDDRQRVLAKYALGTRPVPVADAAVDTDFLRGVRAKEQLWRTSGFPWRRLLSRRELDLLTEEDRRGFGRDMTFYHDQSKRMKQLLRTAQTVGLAMFSLALFFSALLLFFLSLSAYFPDNLVLIYVSPFVFLVLWTLFVLVSSILTARDRPYGVRPSQVFRLYLYGPFGPEIPDYDPNEMPTR
jgi:hypothetical protein